MRDQKLHFVHLSEKSPSTSKMVDWVPSSTHESIDDSSINDTHGDEQGSDDIESDYQSV